MTYRFAFIMAVLAAFAATPAVAQVSFGAGGGGHGHGKDDDDEAADAQARKKKEEEAKAKAPPDALPGAHANKERVTPAEKSSADMEPNEALFDSINRGDIAASREAINRGARMDARNVLGMTPVDLAIDLNRNDILFLLLSYRAADQIAARHVPVREASAEKPKAERGRHPAPAAARTVTAAAQPVPVPSTDGGVPQPRAGFLGFNN